MYRGPFRRVVDDDGHTYFRGERMAVCDKTFRLLSRAPYEGMFAPVPPREEVPLDQAEPFDCAPAARRDPRITKGVEYDATSGGEACGPSGCC